MRGGRCTVHERNLQCQNTLIHYPPGHTGRSFPPPTYWLVLKLRSVNCSERLAFLIYLFIAKTELKMENTAEYYLLISEVKRGCSHFVPKIYLHTDLCACGRESNQRLHGRRWRAMCKEATPIEGKTISNFTVNTCECNRKLELCMLANSV